MANLEINKYCSVLILDGEFWFDIPDYEGKLQASNFGRIKSLPRTVIRGKNYPSKISGCILRQRLDKDGYCKVKAPVPNSLIHRTRTQSVHRLVCATFYSNPDNLPQVNHKDGNKENNAPGNLEWSTTIDNIQHALKSGLRPSRKGEKRKSGIQYLSKWKPVIQFDMNMIEVKRYKTISHALVDGFQIHHINACCKGKKSQYKGFLWKYENIESALEVL